MPPPPRPPPPKGGRSPPSSPPTAPASGAGGGGGPPPVPQNVAIAMPPSKYDGSSNNSNNRGQSPPLMNEANSPPAAISPDSPKSDQTYSMAGYQPELDKASSQAYILDSNKNLPNGQLILPPSKEITFYREQGHTLAWDFCVNIINPLNNFIYYFPKEEESRFDSGMRRKSATSKRNNPTNSDKVFEYDGNTITTDEELTTIQIYKCHLHSHVLKSASVDMFYKDCVDLYEKIKSHFSPPAERAQAFMRFCIGWAVLFTIGVAATCVLYWFGIWSMGFEDDLDSGGKLAIQISFIAIVGIIDILFIYLAVKTSIKSKAIILSQIEQAQEAFKHGLQSKCRGIYSSKHDNLTFSVVIKNNTKKHEQLCILRISNGKPMITTYEQIYEMVKEDENVILQKQIQANMAGGAPPPPKFDDKAKAKIIAAEMDI